MMPYRRFLLEIGMGNDQRGQDYTKAAKRAISNAIRRSSIPFFETLQIDHKEMNLKVTIGVQDPSKVNIEALHSALPRGTAEFYLVKGGLNSTNPDSDNIIVIATAAVEAFIEENSLRRAYK